jgi:hypothetical protein
MPPPASSATSAVGASVLTSIPVPLRDELFAALGEVLRNYRERRWEPSELNGGKLCEVVYSILRGHVDGSFPTKATKPANMVDACKGLEKADPGKFSRSVRIQIPRVLVALYEIRNNRGVGHVGGDVDPNLMDATAVMAMSKWVVAELVRVFHTIPTEKAQELVEAIVERVLPLVWKIGDVLRILDPTMTAEHKVLALLYHARGWLDEDVLRGWVEYANPSMFKDILRKCHKKKLLEYDVATRRAILSPRGISYVETHIPLEG